MRIFVYKLIKQQLFEYKLFDFSGFLGVYT